MANFIHPAGSAADPAPVLLVFDDHWTCALLRAELLERGVVAVCLRRLVAALVPGSPVSLSAPIVVVAEHASPPERPSPRDRDRNALQWLRALDVLQAAALVTSADAADTDGPWDHVVRRPVVLGAIADLAEKLARAAPRPQDHTAPDHPRSPPTLPGFEIRIGSPWPMVLCKRCAAARHCEPPRTAEDLGDVRAELARFGLAHAGC